MTDDNNTEIDDIMPADSDAANGKKTDRCSFCGKDQHEVLLLVAGPAVFICDECIAKAHQIVQEVKEDQARDSRQPE